MHVSRSIVVAALMALACIWAEPSKSVSDPVHQAVQDIQRIVGTSGDHLILLGELHGTREIPRLTGELLAAYAAHGPVVLALEVHETEYQRIRTYLHSSGSQEDAAAMRAGQFWTVTGTNHDGRRNMSILELIEHVRRLKAAGRDVAILPFDPGNVSGGSEARDQFMAKSIRRIRQALRKGQVLVLAGNVHAMLERPSYAPEEMQQPMGFYLKDLEPKSINVSARVGSFWSCITPASCQQAELMPRLAAESGETSQPYSYEIVLPVISLAELLGSEQSSHRKPREEP